MSLPTIRPSTEADDDLTDDEGRPLPTPVGLRRSDLAYATTAVLPHPRLIPRARLGTEPPVSTRLATQRERPSREAPLYLTPAPMVVRAEPRAKVLPPPLRHRPAPPPIPAIARNTTQFDDDAITNSR